MLLFKSQVRLSAVKLRASRSEVQYIGFSVGQQWEQWSITNLHKTEDTPFINAFVSRRSIATVASRKHYQNQRMKSQRRPTAFTSTRSSVELSGRVLLSTCIRKTYFSIGREPPAAVSLLDPLCSTEPPLDIAG